LFMPAEGDRLGDALETSRAQRVQEPERATFRGEKIRVTQIMGDSIDALGENTQGIASMRVGQWCFPLLLLLGLLSGFMTCRRCLPSVVEWLEEEDEPPCALPS
jgi:hypothetical protein